LDLLKGHPLFRQALSQLFLLGLLLVPLGGLALSLGLAQALLQAGETLGLVSVQLSHPLREGVQRLPPRQARPHLIKPNRSELQALAALDGRAEPPSLEPEVAADDAGSQNLEGLAALARNVLARGIEQVVVSLGAAGAMAVTADGLWLARAPKVRLVDPIGAGDSMVAALSAGLHEDVTWPELLARAVAAGSCDVTTFGGGLITLEAVEELRRQVTVFPVTIA